MRRLRAPAVLLVAVLALAGCGSYTQQDYVKAADAICAATVRAERTIPPPSFGRGPDAQLRALARFLTRALPLIERESRSLHGLRRPTGMPAGGATLRRYLAAVSRTTADFEELASDARKQDASGVAAVEARLRAIPIATLAGSYGMSDCASPGATVA
jgi:hypothetical protein